MSDAETDNSIETRKVIAFRIGAQEFCIDIMSVYEIRCWSPATLLPHAPSFVCGVINLRGIVLPIIDLAARFGFPVTQPTSQNVIIVVQINGRTIGLLVDAVTDIVSVNNTEIQATPSIASDFAQNFIRGVFILDKRMISLVALDKIAAPSEKEAA